MITPIDQIFWEEKHAKQDAVWLTGTALNYLIQQHNILPEFLKNKKVLEIGVGLGLCSKNFRQYTDELYCADISQTALDRVKDYARQTFLTGDINKSPAVDLAICHLVFVHCTDVEMTRIINDVNLTHDGVLSFQVSRLVDPITDEKLRARLIDNGSHFFRDFDVTKQIVESTNKEIISITDGKFPGAFDPSLNQEWYFVQVRNKSL